MAHVRDEFLRELQERLARVSTWLGGRRVPESLHARSESVQREVAQVRHAAADDVHDVVARARATLADMDRDYEVPPAHAALRREELEALRQYVRRTGSVLPHVSNLDDPGWPTAHEEYERSWEDLRRAFEPEGSAAAPGDATRST